MKTKSIQQITENEFENRFNTSKMARALRKTTGFSHKVMGSSFKFDYDVNKNPHIYLSNDKNTKILEISPLQILNHKKNKYEDLVYQNNNLKGKIYFFRYLTNFHCSGDNETIINHMDLGISLENIKPKQIAEEIIEYGPISRLSLGSIAFLAHNDNSISISKISPQKRAHHHLYIGALTEKLYGSIVNTFGGVENAEKSDTPNFLRFKNPMNYFNSSNWI